MPPAFTLRTAHPNDATQIAQVQIRSWRRAYKGIIDQAFLDTQLDLDAHTAHWKKALSDTPPQDVTFLAHDNTTLAGYATAGPSRDHAFADHGELHTLYVDPSYAGQGVGTLLLENAHAHITQQGFTKVFVNVLTKNTTARSFYERMNGTLMSGSHHDIIVGGKPYAHVKYRWP